MKDLEMLNKVRGMRTKEEIQSKARGTKDRIGQDRTG
jgi:hypothetical protein